MPNTARANFFRRIEDVLGKRFRKEPNPERNGGEGGILTQSRLLFYYLFINMHENRMDIGAF